MIEMIIMLIVLCGIAIVYSIVLLVGSIVGKLGRFDD